MGNNNFYNNLYIRMGNKLIQHNLERSKPHNIHNFLLILYMFYSISKIHLVGNMSGNIRTYQMVNNNIDSNCMFHFQSNIHGNNYKIHLVKNI